MSNDWSHTTRRDILALTGATVFAGCNGLVGRGDSSPTISGKKLGGALSQEVPVIAQPLPVTVETVHLDAHRRRAQELLSRVPTPLTREDIPNGAIREDFTQMVEHSRDILDRSRKASTPLAAINLLTEAREQAGSVATGWAIIDERRTRSDIRTAAREQQDAVGAFRDRWRYFGSKPVPAVFVHAMVEQRVDEAEGRIESVLDPPKRMNVRDNPVDLGELGGQVEAARAAREDAGYVYRRYRSSRQASRSLRKTFEAADESLGTTIDERWRDLDLPTEAPENPSAFVDRNIAGTPIGRAMLELYEHGLDVGDEPGDRADRPAGAVLATHATLANLRAFAALRERVANDEYVTVKTVDDIELLRKRALDAVDTALSAATHPRLNRALLTDLVGRIEYADERLREMRDHEEVEIEWLDRALTAYVSVAAVATATPAASMTVAETLQSDT